MAEQFEIRIADGTVFKGWHWPAEEAKANLCVITGMDEYAFRYDRFAQWMNAHAVNVWVLDALGQGLNAASVEEQEIWPDDAFAKHIEAIHAMDVMAAANGLPTTQMGHSMGSFMTQAVIQAYPAATDGVILMGSNGGQAGLMKTASRLSKVLVNKKNRDLPNKTLTVMGLGAYAKAIKDAKTPVDWLSYNEENVKQYIDDPYCGNMNTGGFWQEFLKGMATLWDDGSMAKVSKNENILLTSGMEDPVGQNSKGVRWLYNAYKKQGVKNVVLKLYPMMRHEILNEDEWEKVCEDILAFLPKND